MENKKRDFATITRSTKDDRTFEFVFSTATKDRHGTVVNPQGWDLRNFLKNPVASYQHDLYGSTDPDIVIGRANAWIEGEALIGTITFETKDVNELADKLYRKVKAGTLSAVSVGFLEIASHWGNSDAGEDPETKYFDKQELIEISLVSIPSNPDAVKRGLVRTYAAKTAPALVEEIKEKNIINYNIKIEEMMKKKFTGKTPEQKAVERYSITKALDQFTEEKKGMGGKLDGIELEMHQEAEKEAKESGKSISGLGIPSLIHSRTMQATVDASGGYLNANEMGDLEQALRENTVTGKAGATVLTGLKGDFKLPKVATDSTAAWRAEGGQAPKSDMTFAQESMTPHRLTFYTVVNNQLLKQTSPGIEREIYRALYAPIELGLEDAVFNGSGSSNVPQGLFGRGINDGDHGSNGTILSWPNVLQLPKMVAADNALKGSLGYITNSTAAFKMMETTSTTGKFMWEQTPFGGYINGWPAYQTNVIENDRTRGTNNDCSALIFGAWNELVIGQWGAIDVLPNPFDLSLEGKTRITVAGYFDLAVKHTESFAAILGLEN